MLLEDLCAALGGKTPYYLFLDDFHLLGDERVAQFLCRLAYRLPENVHLIVASRNRFLPGEQVVRLGRRLHRIEADGLRLNREELLAYTHRCGVEITAAQAESLLRSCEGWFSAVYLNLHALAERGSLLQLGSDIYAMFTAAMLESLPEKTRGFLAVMGLADEFTVEMARAVTALPDAEEVLRALTQQNAFVTRLPDGVSFRFHHMMKECAERLFAQLPAARQTEVWQRYGRWYAQKAQYLHALQAFEHCGDRDAALARVEVEDSGGVGRGDRHPLAGRQAAAIDAGVPEDGHAFLDAAGAVRNLGEVIGTHRLLRSTEGAVVGRRRVQLAGLQAAPQGFLMVLFAERRAHHVRGGGREVGMTIDAIVDHQMPGEHFAIHALAARPGAGDGFGRLLT